MVSVLLRADILNALRQIREPNPHLRDLSQECKTSNVTLEYQTVMHYSNSFLELHVIKQRAQCSSHQNGHAQALNVIHITSYVAQINNLTSFVEYILFLNLRVFHLLKNFLNFMESDGSLPSSQEPSTCLCSEAL